MPSAVTSALYFVIFGSLIGQRVGLMDGVPYMQYIAPGLIMMAVITNSYGNVVSSFFGAKFGKHVEEMLVAPLPNWIIVLGYVGGGLVRGFLVGGAVTIVSLIFTQLAVHHAFVIFAAVVLTSVVFSLGGFINAMFAKNFDQVNWIPTFVLTPLTYFGGVFYSISLLPEWAQAHFVREPDPAHGERVPLRLPRHQRRQRLRRVRDHAGLGGGAVRGRAVLHEPRHRHARVVNERRGCPRSSLGFSASASAFVAHVGRGLLRRIDVALHFRFQFLALLRLFGRRFGFARRDRRGFGKAAAGQQ